jgi:hypothetical protein
MPEKKALKKPAPNKEKFSNSPIMDRSKGKTDQKKAPPALYRAPKPNPNVEPLQRSSRLGNMSQKWEDKRQKPEIRGQQPTGKIQEPGNKGYRSEDRGQKSNGRQQKGDEGKGMRRE